MYDGVLKHQDVLENYEVVNKIGSGGFSEVFLVRHKVQDKCYAMKIMDKANISRRK